tara:strand:- start:348 stop:797 length:450 start_codon:yes stop_codon:yes gene_type:complete
MKQAYFSLPCPNKIDNESPIFRGYYDVNQNWNGWKCPKFKEKEFDKIVKYYLDKETNTDDMIEELKEFSDKEKNKVIIDNEEYYDFGSFCLCWSAIESSDIINKLCDYVLKDEEYLHGILYEYLDILEEKEEIGLCGIVETLEDRGVRI